MFKCLLACLRPEYIHESVVLPIVVIGDDKNDDDDDDNDNDEDDCEDDADDAAAANDDNTFKRVSYVLIFRVFFLYVYHLLGVSMCFITSFLMYIFISKNVIIIRPLGENKSCSLKEQTIWEQLKFILA